MSRLSGLTLAWLLALVSTGILPLEWHSIVAGAQSKSKQDDWLHDLKKDARLNIAMNIRFTKRPAYTAVFDEIKKATGVSISLARESEMTGATFGNMTFYKTPAWTVLQQIAETQVRNGRWEKSKNGYVLHGEPRPRGLYIDGPDAEKARLAEKEASHKEIAERQNAVADLAKMHPLGMDRKLRAKLTIIESQATLRPLIDRLEDSTGLNLTLAENLTYHEPDLGNISLTNEFAYTFIELIAKCDLDDGRWEKTDDGYRLEGVSRSLRPPPRRSYAWAWITGGTLLALAAAGGAFVMYRRRGKQPPGPALRKKPA